jgi:hypothetical protein
MSSLDPFPSIFRTPFQLGLKLIKWNGAVDYSLEDLKYVSPTMSMRKINLEEDSKIINATPP